MIVALTNILTIVLATPLHYPGRNIVIVVLRLEGPQLLNPFREGQQRLADIRQDVRAVTLAVGAMPHIQTVQHSIVMDVVDLRPTHIDKAYKNTKGFTNLWCFFL